MKSPRLILTLVLLAPAACDKPSGAPAGGGSAPAASEKASQPWVGGFRKETRTGDLFISSRLVLTTTRAEYNVQSTRNGELFIQQLCSAPIDGANAVPVIPAMTCEIALNGNRMTRTTAFDFSFNGTAWLLRHNGESTALERIDGGTSVASGASTPAAMSSTTPTSGGSLSPAPAGKPDGAVGDRWRRAECARKATGGFTNLPEYMATLKPDGAQASAWLAAYNRCIAEGGASRTAGAPASGTPVGGAPPSQLQPAAPRPPAPVPARVNWAGSFAGISSDGSARLGLVVSQGGIRFIVDGPDEPMVCSAAITGLRSSMYRIGLDCGSEMALAGVDTRISMFWSGDSWRVDGSGSFSGLSGVLSRR